MKPDILKLARDDLKEIHESLSEYGENPPRRFRSSFEKFCVNVEEMPFMFSQYEHNPNYRRGVIAFDYLVFYKVEVNSGRVRIYRVLHGKRDIETLLDYGDTGY